MQTEVAETSTAAEASAGGSTRERILDAAEMLFGAQGYAGTAMRDIASRVGINAASLYNHFDGKDALYAAVLERGLKPVLTLIDNLTHSEWTPDLLDAAAEALVDDLARRPQVSRLLLQEALSGGERLKQSARHWLRPLYGRALESFEKRSHSLPYWDKAELPLVLLSFHHLIVGHFAVTPMLEELFETDPLSEAAIAVHRGFVRKFVRLLFFDPSSSATARASENTALNQLTTPDREA